MNPEEKVLQELRTQIDDVDKQLVRLLVRRKELVARVGEIKNVHGLPVYIPDREARLLSARRAEAERQGISPDLMEDVLRRIMRESYAAEGASGYKRTGDAARSVAIVGGGSGIGAFFVKHFERSGYPVRVLERDDWKRAGEILDSVSLVLVSVPINNTTEVIRRLTGLLPQDCLLADVTSIKRAPLDAMMAAHPGPVIGLHPMFGPSTIGFAKQVVVYCKGRFPEKSAWLLEQIRIWGAHLLAADPAEHDRMMAMIQAMRHFATYVYGQHLYEEAIDLETVLDFSSPIYRLELGMVGRLFAQEPTLYADIIFGSEEGKGIAARYLERFRGALDMLACGDRETFIEQFRKISDWFGPLGARFLDESSFMLARAQERYDQRRDRPARPEDAQPAVDSVG